MAETYDLIVIGSGIMAGRLSPTDIGIQLFENAAATELSLSAEDIAALEEPYQPHPIAGHV